MPSSVSRRTILWSSAAIVGVAGAIFGAWLFSLPSAAPVAEAPQLAKTNARQLTGTTSKIFLRMTRRPATSPTVG